MVIKRLSVKVEDASVQAKLPSFKKQTSFGLVPVPPMTINVLASIITPWAARPEFNCPALDQVHAVAFKRKIELSL